MTDVLAENMANEATNINIINVFCIFLCSLKYKKHYKQSISIFVIVKNVGTHLKMTFLFIHMSRKQIGPHKCYVRKWEPSNYCRHLQIIRP